MLGAERVGQDHAPVRRVGLELWPTTGTVDVLGARYGRVDSRELRRRIGYAGSAVEAALRADLTPVTWSMTARHAATEPWWHVYTDEDRARARGLLDDLGSGRWPISRTGRCRPASGGGPRSPGR